MGPGEKEQDVWVAMDLGVKIDHTCNEARYGKWFT